MNNKSIKNIETAKNLLAQAKQLKKQDKIIAATNILLKAKKLDPNNLHIWEFLALYKRFAGDSESAMQMIDKAVKLAEQQGNIAEEVVAKELYLKTIYYLNPPNLTPQLIQKSCKLYADAIHKIYTPKYNFDKLIKIFHKQKNKRLKIGLVGGDFKQHAVHFFIQDLIEFFNFKNINGSTYKSIEIYIYMTADDEDHITAEIRKSCRVYRKVDKLNYRQIADLIFADGIHILVDLANHTSYNRLPSFALKPAPIQCSWMGVPTTSGLNEVDYFFADEFCMPSQNNNTKFEFTEKIYRFPNIWECFTPNQTDGLICNEIAQQIFQKTQMPVNKNGYITFCNFSNTLKLTASTIKLWAKILQEIPTAKLILFRSFYDEAELRSLFLSKFAEQSKNILQRIQFLGKQNANQYFQILDGVDLILETFPVSGMTTTAESLYLGIPTLTLLGDFMPSRCSGTCINAIGDKNLNDLLICETPEKYINQAVYFANNPQVLDEVHQTLQKKVRKSPLCDSELFAKNFEKSMWQIWNEFLEKNQQNQQK